jgi:hypothetical protein
MHANARGSSFSPRGKLLPLRPSTPFSFSPPLTSSTKKRGLHQFSQINRLVVEAVEENMDEKDRMMAEESEPGIWNRNNLRNP